MLSASTIIFIGNISCNCLANTDLTFANSLSVTFVINIENASLSTEYCETVTALLASFAFPKCVDRVLGSDDALGEALKMYD